MERRRSIYNSPKTGAQIRNNWSVVGPPAISGVDGPGNPTGSSGVTQGQVVAINASGELVPALADGSDLSNVVGLADEDAPSGYPAQVFTAGPMLYSPGGLTAGTRYYLSAVTPGEITAAPDDITEGAVSIIVGVARSATELFVDTQLVARY